MKRLLVLPLMAALLYAYPLDGDKRTGIRRLIGYRLAQTGQAKGPKVPPGGQWPADRVQLRLLANRTLDIGPQMPKDPALQKGLEAILGGRNLSYGMALLDITDPQKPRYAAVRETSPLPGSVGKLRCHRHDGRSRAQPDIAAREKLLRPSDRPMVLSFATARLSLHESGLRLSQPPDRHRRQVQPLEWLDHMLSQSSNAAGSFHERSNPASPFRARYPCRPLRKRSTSSTPNLSSAKRPKPLKTPPRCRRRY
jgi:hypothetical protein